MLSGCFYKPTGVESSSSTGPAPTTGTSTSTGEAAPTTSEPGTSTSSSSSGSSTTTIDPSTSDPNTATSTTGPQTPATTSEPESTTGTTGTTETSSTSTGDTDDTSGTTMTGPMCGNNILEDGEECDGTDLNGVNCKTVIPDKWGGGVLTCNASCQSFNDKNCCFGVGQKCSLLNNEVTCCPGLKCDLSESCNPIP